MVLDRIKVKMAAKFFFNPDADLDNARRRAAQLFLDGLKLKGIRFDPTTLRVWTDSESRSDTVDGRETIEIRVSVLCEMP